MKTTDKNKTEFPQTVEIPQPLEIHPSVDPELARGLIAAVEHIEAHPESFNMAGGHFDGGKGCVICHVERLSSWKRTDCGTQWNKNLPLGHWGRIYAPDNWARFHGFNNPNRLGIAWEHTHMRLARIEHFLRTGE